MPNFVHGGKLGDMVFAIPAINALGGGTLYTKNKYNIFLGPLFVGHTLVSDMDVYNYPPRPGKKSLAKVLEPLVFWSESHQREIINLDLYKDTRRHYIYSAEWVCTLVSKLPGFVQQDLEKPWLLDIPKKEIAKLVMTWTPYQHDKEEIDYNILSDYMKDLIFLGSPKDYWWFSQKFSFRPELITANNGLEVASIIAGSKLYIGNQGFCWSVAEAMKHPRVLEISYVVPMAGPVGPNAWTILTREIVEEKLYG